MSKRLDYHKMVQKVLEIDEEAAEYLLSKDIKKLPGFKKRSDLLECFIFSDSLQGSTFWYSIAKQIGE